MAIPVSDISQPVFRCILYTQETTWTLCFLTIGELRAEAVRPCCWKEQPCRKNIVYRGNYEFQLYKYTENKWFIHNQEDSIHTHLFWGRIAVIKTEMLQIQNFSTQITTWRIKYLQFLFSV